MAKFMSQVGAGLAALVTATATVLAEESHVVTRGETLTSIAEHYGLDMETLAETNGISNLDFVWAGQVLRIPGVEAVEPISGFGFHLVAPGESLGVIAARYGTTVNRLSEMNEIANPDYIHAGQTIAIPSSGTVAPQGVPRYTRDEAGWVLLQAELEFGLPPGLMRALAWQESGWQSWVVSYAGAVGLAQIMPDTGNWVVQYLLPDAKDWATNPTNNARVGAAFLRYLLDLTGWDVQLALGGYYQGLTNISRYGYYDDTLSYIANVLYFQEWYR
jgi:LysM repeat protein